MNPENQFDRRSLLVASLLAVMLVIVCGSLGMYVLSDPDIRLVHQFASVFAQIDQSYNEELDHDDLIDAARQGMYARLDRYSTYISKAGMARMREEISGGYSGIGVTVVNIDKGLLVVAIHQNGPAEKAKLLIGDIIHSANGESLARDEIKNPGNLLRGHEGDSLELSVFRLADNDTLQITLTRERVRLEHIPFAGFTDDSLIYIRLDDFSAGASADISEAIDSLLAIRAATGLILDLKSNPGGLLLEAYKTADLFVEADKLIVGTDGRSRWRDYEVHSTGDDMIDGLPMAILVDGNSASSSEIVAGALSQLGRALLVGDTTFGKGLVQGYTSLTDGSGMKLTISRYYLEGGLYLNEFDSTFSETGSGLIPNHYYEFSATRMFPLRLENSFLLFEFAAIYQDSIIAGSTDQPLPERWIERFTNYAIDNDFKFESAGTIKAKLVLEFALLRKKSRQLINATRNLVTQAEKHDLSQFAVHADYIRLRLSQLAWQRKFGSSRAWDEIVLDSRPDIRFAADILLGETK